MKKGLILEGGAMRGMFTAGVIDVMMENGIKFDGAIGVSAGAAFGCNYKSGQIGRVIRYNTRFVRDKRYCGLPVLLKEGNIYSAEFCYVVVPRDHDVFDFDAYEANPMEFFVVATDIESGKPVYHKLVDRNDHGFEWIRASASMPLLSTNVVIDGQTMLDGGISDSIPLQYFESMGYGKNIVVLTQKKGYKKKKFEFMPLLKMRYGKKYPKMVETMANEHINYNDTLDYIAQKEARGEILAIYPEVDLPVALVERDPEKLRAAYEIGRETALRRLDEIKKYLNHA